MWHLVTGGSGFLGNLVARRLSREGEQVRILDVWEDPSRPKEIEFVHADICDRGKVAEAMRGIDVVHHNVALVPLTKSGSRFWDVNVTGSLIAAEEAAKAGIKSFIHMSSSAVYGVPPACPITSKTPENPAEIYGRAKTAGEFAVREVCAKRQLPLVVIRPRTILGEGRLGIFQILFSWIIQNRNVYVIGSGDVGFQFVHAMDLLDAYMLILKSGKTGVFSVGTDRFGTLRQALEGLILYAGSSSKVKSLPVLPTITALRLLDFMRLSPLAPWHYLTYHKAFYFDVTPLLQMGWMPKYSNDEMLRESLDWFRFHPQSSVSEGGSAHRRPVREGILRLIKKLS